MNRSKRIYILRAVLAAVSLATIAAPKLVQRQEKIRNSEDMILSVPADAVTGLSWSYDEESLAFSKDADGVWRWEEDEAFPVSGERINELLAVFSDFSVSFAIEDVEDYSQYGLDAPVCTITLTTEDETYTLTLGDFSKLDSQRYVSIGDGNAYLVSTDPMDSYELTIRDMIANDPALEYDAVSAVHIVGAETWDIRYSEEENRSVCAEDRYYTGDLPLDTSRVDSYLSSLCALSLTDYVSYNVTDAELETYGLNDPELSVTVDYTDEDGTESSYTLHLSRSAAERADDTEETDEDGASVAYARVGDSQIIYEISAATFEKLSAATYNDLRHQAAFTADFSDAASIEVTLEEQTFTLTAPADADDADGKWLYGEEEIEISGVQAALEALAASEFTEELPAGQEEIALTVFLDNEAFPSVRIVLYRYDGASCLATVDGEPFALVPRAQMVDLVEAIQAIVLN
ncbi:MAG: DUF4340 domain-containing protein [Oscillospiraceae bacterium]|nr:DUF4340 domain-containing protein [Oscillospiraceae bacterium]